MTTIRPLPPSGADRRADGARNPDWRRAVEEGFARAPFVLQAGIRFVDCGPGWCESTIELAPHHAQNTGVTHAGVIATLADHTSGGAAISVAAADEIVLTAEFKLSLLRAVAAERLHCRAEVIKPGRRLTFVEASVEAEQGGGERSLVARASVTLAVMPAKFHPAKETT